tara:strand:- start:6845 stop:7177 length:333 start_codon:yes stop_codon:yes gene_type:complete
MLQQQAHFALPGFALERLSRSGKPETFGSAEDKWRLLTILFGRQNQGRKTALRDIHTLLDMPQHVAFRLVRGLEMGGLITVGPCLYDAFAAELALTEECSALVTRVLANG